MYLVRSLRTFIGTNAERTLTPLESFLAGDEFIETDTSNKYLHDGMAWRLEPAGVPGGNDTQVQFNDGGVFEGDSGLVFDKTTKVLTIGGGITVEDLLDVQPTGIVFNGAETDIDFRIAGNGVEFGYFYDAGNNRHGFGTGLPDTLVHIAGNASVVGYLNVNTTSNPPAGGLGVIHCYGAAPGFFFYEQGTTDNNVFFVYDAGLMQFQNRTDAGGFTSSPFVFDMTSATNTFRVNSSRVGIGTDPTNVSAKLEIAGTTGAVLLPRLTTTQQNALTAVNGMIIYNSTTGKFTGYAGGAWVALH